MEELDSQEPRAQDLAAPGLNPPLTMASKLIGPGSRLGASHLVQIIGEGSFSWVFRVLWNPPRPEPGPLLHRAVKLAKPAAYLQPEQRRVATEPFPTAGFGGSAFLSQGVMIGTGYVGKFQPDPAELLVLQAEKIRAAADEALVTVHEIVREGELCWCGMELLEGLTLRNLIVRGQVSLPIFVDLARKMDRLQRNPAFSYHGDLKPENIMVHCGRVKLIDPGYFGEGESTPFQGVVTSPAYYPMLNPDDLFAVGLMLWEAALGQHPFFFSTPSAESRESGLREWVRRFELVGQYLLTPLRYLPRPAECKPGLHPEMDQLLLKALGLGITDSGKLERTATKGASGYASFAELAGDLAHLSSLGIDFSEEGRVERVETSSPYWLQYWDENAV